MSIQIITNAFLINAFNDYLSKEKMSIINTGGISLESIINILAFVVMISGAIYSLATWISRKNRQNIEQVKEALEDKEKTLLDKMDSLKEIIENTEGKIDYVKDNVDRTAERLDRHEADYSDHKVQAERREGNITMIRRDLDTKLRDIMEKVNGTGGKVDSLMRKMERIERRQGIVSREDYDNKRDYDKSNQQQPNNDNT